MRTSGRSIPALITQAVIKSNEADVMGRHSKSYIYPIIGNIIQVVEVSLQTTRAIIIPNDHSAAATGCGSTTFRES
jgi:hypothetical protein